MPELTNLWDAIRFCSYPTFTAGPSGYVLCVCVCVCVCAHVHVYTWFKESSHIMKNYI